MKPGVLDRRSRLLWSASACGAIVHPHLVADFVGLIRLSRASRMKHNSERRQSAYFFRKRSKKGSNSIFVYRRAPVGLEHIDKLLPVCLVASALFSTLTQ